MVKHIVFWRLKADLTGAARDEAMIGIRKGFEAMRGVVPGLLRIEVGFNYAESPDASDIALYSEFESRAALAGYQDHPAHLAMLPIVREVRTERRVIDYEV
jgi:hypothetical protein